jgi:hypothetical protein
MHACRGCFRHLRQSARPRCRSRSRRDSKCRSRRVRRRACPAHRGRLIAARAARRRRLLRAAQRRPNRKRLAKQSWALRGAARVAARCLVMHTHTRARRARRLPPGDRNMPQRATTRVWPLRHWAAADGWICRAASPPGGWRALRCGPTRCAGARGTAAASNAGGGPGAVFRHRCGMNPPRLLDGMWWKNAITTACKGRPTKKKAAQHSPCREGTQVGG